jgi:DNA-directed RNA polymerase specialized sigma24 family protein
VNADDVVDTALERALPLRARRALVGNPWGYLVRVAVHCALDELRQLRRHAPAQDAPELPDDEDTIERLLQARGAEEDVIRGIRLCREAGDENAVRVAEAFLDLAESGGEVPSSRKISERLNGDLSHAAVQRALRRFRDRLQ